MVGITIIAVVGIICASILFCLYMACCQESGVGMFQDQKHEERIKKLEEQMEELKKE